MDPQAAKLIGAGLACTALIGAGIGIGNIFGNYLAGAMRNPSAAPGQFTNLLIGFALAERRASSASSWPSSSSARSNSAQGLQHLEVAMFAVLIEAAAQTAEAAHGGSQGRWRPAADERGLLSDPAVLAGRDVSRSVVRAFEDRPAARRRRDRRRRGAFRATLKRPSA